MVKLLLSLEEMIDSEKEEIIKEINKLLRLTSMEFHRSPAPSATGRSKNMKRNMKKGKRQNKMFWIDM